MSQNTRSTLKPYLHKRRRKWYPRGTFPIKGEDGKIERKRDYYGPSSDTRALCQVDCDRLNRELESAATSGPLEPTFEEAVATYLGTGGDKRFLGEVEGGPRNKLLDFLGSYRVNEITDTVMGRAVTQLYPTAAAVTVNRQLFTPVISVLRLAAKGKTWKPDLKRPEGHSKLKPAKAPADTWYAAVGPECRPQLIALLLFCTTSGRRAGEAMRCLPADFNPEDGTVFIGKDKNGNAILVRLAQAVVEAIQSYNWQKGPGLFGHYIPKNRRNLFRDLKAACKRAGVPYFPPHKAGRHAFAKRVLQDGYSLAHLMGMGGWDNARTPTELYGHFAHSEVAEDAKRVGEKFLSRVSAIKDNVVELEPQRRRSVVTKR